MEEKEIDGRVYEVGYLLVPTISEEELPTSYGNLKELVGSFGGNVISDEMPKMIDLSFPMFKTVKNVRSKFSTGYFGWVKFFMDPEKALELKKKLDLDPTIIRFLMIKTVKENTIAAKRFVHRDTVRRKVPTMKKEGEVSDAAPINKEEVDKEIDAMVA
jgi:ribosomal protein S6